MNYKLEKFWNSIDKDKRLEIMEWTINLKSFEIAMQTQKCKTWLYEL